MPELPEVETIASKLKQILINKKIKNINILHNKSFIGDFKQILDQEIIDINRRAKIINFKFKNNLNLITHLKMTGQLIYLSKNKRVGGGHPTSDFINSLPSKHTRIIYDFSDKSKLFFNDQRIFGWMKIVDQKNLEKIFKNYGPDINNKNLKYKYLLDKLAKRRISIKQAIMQNNIIAGLGNIYACDSLNLARINPFRPAKSLSKLEIKKLLKSAKFIINKAIKLGGTTFDGKYVDIEGMAGNYQDQLLVYGREGENCYNCKAIIKKEKLAGRGTYYCPKCQI